MVAQTERRKDFEAFREALEAHIQPVGALEAVLVDRVASCAWRLRRATHIEAELFAPVVSKDWEETEDGEDLREVKTVSTSLAHALRERRHSLETVGRYERAIETSLFRALHELQRLQAARQGAPVGVPAALDVSVAVAEPIRDET